MLAFGNPLALWGLLAVPALVAIHFIQARKLLIPTSTLFLIERLSPRSESSKQLSRFRSSLSFWIQLITVLLLVLALSEPYLRNVMAQQKVLLIVDSSFSMQAFQSTLSQKLRDPLAKVASQVAVTEWIVLESGSEAKQIYRGYSLDHLLGSLQEWRAGSGSHDLNQAIAHAKSVMQETVRILLVSDREAELLDKDVNLITVGEPFENVGVVGVDVSAAGHFKIFVRNYGKKEAARSWGVSADASGSVLDHSLALAAQSMQVIEGEIPEGTQQLVFGLSHDKFLLDDYAPLLRSKLPVLKYRLDVREQLERPLVKVFDSIGLLTRVGEGQTPDFLFVEKDSLQNAEQDLPSIQILKSNSHLHLRSNEPIVATSHGLTENLLWQTLLCAPLLESLRGKILLWQGSRPLVALDNSETQLLFNFDLTQSNALSQPAFIVLLERFISNLREQSFVMRQMNLELGQELEMPRTEGTNFYFVHYDLITKSESRSVESNILRAPVSPGFSTVSQDGELFFRAAVTFADVQEGDFSNATSVVHFSDQESLQNNEQIKEGSLYFGFLLIAMAAAMMFSSWWFGERAADRL